MDTSLLEVIANALLLAGIATLVSSFAPLRSIISQLQPGPVLRRWYLHAGYIGGFIAAYLSYAAVSFGEHGSTASLIVPAVFFFGACFVWRTVQLALRTVGDVRRVALLEQESITDHLTGLHNRRYLERRLDEEFQRARRYAQPLAVLMIDIDRFKLINDVHGHPAGDTVLQQVGALCLGTARSTDIVARYGGDELVVVAPSTAPAQALVLAERLRRAIEAEIKVLEYTSSGPLPLNATISIGVAALSSGVDGPKSLLQAADAALYRAKSEGRNRVSLDLGSRAAERAANESSAPARDAVTA
jgi:diguanylate cyclase (GGDEF)-like protein